MKAKSKSSKQAAKKPAAKKKVVAATGKKRAAKPVKKSAAATKARKAGPKKTAGRSAAGKKSGSTTRKKKAPEKTAKRSAPKRQPSPDETPTLIIEETSVTVTTTLPENEAPFAPPSGLLIGRVTHYYDHAHAAIIELEAGTLQVGETIHIKGHTTDFEQVVESMEFEDQRIETAEAGLTIGVKVRDVVREHDKVYKKERFESSWSA